MATIMGLRMIQCGRQTVQVIQPDGEVRELVIPVKVSDLILLHPHHFVAHASSSPSSTVIASSKRGHSSMLPLDAQLETGIIYEIIPLPRLFPESPPPVPHLCACFLSSFSSYEHSSAGTGIGIGIGIGIGSAIRAQLMRHWPVRGTTISFPPSSSKISPEENGGAASSFTPLYRRVWEPELQVISEDRVLLVTSPIKQETQGQALNKESAHDNRKGKKLVSSILTLSNLNLNLSSR